MAACSPLSTPIWLISLLMCPLCPSLLPWCFTEKDGSYTGRMWRLYWDCWWYCHPCLYRSWTWCLPMEVHRSGPKYGLVFNPKKTQVKAPTVKFFGCLYDESGVHPDPDKVDAVHALPTSTNITELQEFLGMVTYLSPFIPGLSTLTAPLHDLLKKDAKIQLGCPLPNSLSMC